MATRLYFRNIDAPSSIGTTLRYMAGGRGASVVTNTVTLTNGGNNIPWTITAGGTAARWVSPPVPAGGFTLDGNITFNAWARESNNNDETTIGFRVYKLSGGSESEVSGSPFSFGTELTTTVSAKNWTGNPGSTAFAAGDRIVFVPIAIATTTMTTGSADFTTNGGTAGASGDSYIELTETVDFDTETITKTIKTAGGDYALLSTWEAALQSDLVTDDWISQAECYAGAYTDAVNVVGWTTGASNYVRIFTPTAERHNGTARDVSGTGFQIANSGATVITSTEDYVRLEGLDVKTTSATLSALLSATGITATNNSLQIDDCIFQATALTTAYCVNLVGDTDTRGHMRNCIVYSSGNGINAANSSVFEFSHCTVQSAGATGMLITGNNHTIKNVYSGGATTCFSGAGTPAAYSHNASTDATADDKGGGTGCLINLTAADQFVSITGGSEDFHLKAGTSLNAAGTPLGAVTDDIVGTARDGSTPDIGAFEFISITGDLAGTLAPVTASISGIEEMTGTIPAGTLQAVTAALSGDVEAGAEPTGTIEATLAVVTAALQGAETFTGELAGTLAVVTAELTGTETFTGTLEATLAAVTSALAGDVVAPVTGELAGTLAAVTAALVGDGGGALDVAGPVFSRRTYALMAARKRKTRKQLEEVREELLEVLAPEPVTAPLPPFPVAPADTRALRAEVNQLLAALRAREDDLADDEAAILALMEAA
jgi:hypothetical protein